MRVLLDENVPRPLLESIRWILRGHEVDHVNNVRWKGTKDRELYVKAKRHGYEVVLSNDSSQLGDPGICKAIRTSGLSVVFYDVRGNGLSAHAAAAGAILHCVRQVVANLVDAKEQRIAIIKPLVSPENRFESYDPERDYVSPYWPGRRQYDRNRPSRRDST